MSRLSKHWSDIITALAFGLCIFGSLSFLDFFAYQIKQEHRAREEQFLNRLEQLAVQKGFGWYNPTNGNFEVLTNGNFEVLTNGNFEVLTNR